jgi:leucyl-tRNA synthetase
MSDAPSVADQPPFRYNARLAGELELRWQQWWQEHKVYETPNPVGPLSDGFEQFKGKDKIFIMDMFPYPSGSGLHVGHPLGYLGTDVFARFNRMNGRHVLHTMGYDAFGLPAEQYAVQTGTHPRVTTENNIENMRQQMARLGVGHDMRRSIATTDVGFYRWTQWIFLQVFNSWFDDRAKKARPITELIQELDAGIRRLNNGRDWAVLSDVERMKALENYRLAYIAEVPVNWCPALGTVLANEEVTNEGRSERGNYPVYRRPMRQWMMRITAFSERLLDDLDALDWSDSIKTLQRNWIGRSTGARVKFGVDGSDKSIEVFTTRPDTLFGATYMVLAPEHPLVESLTTPETADAVASYVRAAINKSDLERQTNTKDKTGVFTGSFAINPVNGNKVPVYIADYVLSGYGTGAIMAVPAHDQRDFDFAREHKLPLAKVIKPSTEWLTEHGIDDDAPFDNWPVAYSGDGDLINSHNGDVSLDGLKVNDAKARICEWLEAQGRGSATVTFKLRDWLFSRQRYWGEPLPIVWDERETPIALPDSMLPLELPEVDDYAPKIVDADEETLPEPPLARATEWNTVTLDLGLGDGPKQYRRDLNTMPQWAGSCWYYLAYIDPDNKDAIVDPVNEQYWMNVDLYVGGVEHAVLHLLYSRFWHKVLFDLGHVSTPEPFQRLYNQGYIQADAFIDERDIYVDAFSVEERDGKYFFDGRPVTKLTGKMGKSKKNSINPDDMYEEYGADSLRLYEMSMGPLDADRPWTTTGIVGLYRFLQRLWRNVIDEETGMVTVSDQATDDETKRLLHKTIAGVRDDMESLRFNTAIAKLIELNNHLTKTGVVTREVANAVTLLLAPLAPHVAEEMWHKLGNTDSVVNQDFPLADPTLLVEALIDVPVQVQGKVRARISVAPGTDQATLEAIALAEPAVMQHLVGKTVRKVVVVTDRMVNIVAG